MAKDAVFVKNEKGNVVCGKEENAGVIKIERNVTIKSKERDAVGVNKIEGTFIEFSGAATKDDKEEGIRVVDKAKRSESSLIKEFRSLKKEFVYVGVLMYIVFEYVIVLAVAPHMKPEGLVNNESRGGLQGSVRLCYQ